MQADRMEVDSDAGIKRKGRGFSSKDEHEDPRGEYKTVATSETTADRAQRSIEGWIVIVTNVHEEANEDELMDRFSDYGTVKNLHLNLDRRTGFVKGYALVEYETKAEAETAIAEAPQEPFLEKVLACDFAFVQPTEQPAEKETARPARGRSASPSRKASLLTRIT